MARRWDIRLDNVPEPKIQEPTDAVVRLTASAICGTDLHFIRGTMSDFEPGTRIQNLTQRRKDAKR